ncbi:MAG: bifunctional alpha/beta hydrolase/OsmC family protein [Pseudomonadota bacterium]
MQTRQIQFDNQEGQALAGLIDLPSGPTRAWALFAHCFTCSKNLKAAKHLAQSLTDAGIAVLRFDFTGLGQSEGEFSETSFSSNVGDLLAAAAWLEKEHEAPALLLGHSLGGTAVLRAARFIPSALAVATIGSPAEPAHVQHLFADSLDEIEETGSAELNLGGRAFRVKQEFIEDLSEHDLLADVRQLRKALLIMHAPLDDTVEIDNASTLFLAARHPKSFLSLDKADHLLSREEDSRYAGLALAAWASRYLPSEERPPLAATPAETVARTFGDSFTTELVSGGHRLLADEPESVGGNNFGPSPYDLLSAALASCTTMTLKMYAAHKQLKLRSTTVRVQHGKVHAKDCADCESESGKIDEFLRELSFDGDLSEAELARLVEIADRCPVHRTLHGEVKVRTRLAED